MNFDKDKSDSGLPEINLTSLVDVVFLLVLFFAVTTTFPQKQQGLKINLPEVNKKSEVKLSKPIRIYLDKEGNLYYNKSLINKNDLSVILKNSADKTVVLNADKDTTHGKVVDVIEMIKNKGVKKVLISVKYGRK